MAKKRTAKKAAPQPTRRRARARAVEPGPIPDRIFAQASPFSLGGVSMFEAGPQITSSTVANFNSETDLLRRSAEALRDAGFEILQISQLTINIAGSKAVFERAFNAPIVAEERDVIKPEGPSTATFLECPTTEIPGLIVPRSGPFSELLEGIARFKAAKVKPNF